MASAKKGKKNKGKTVPLVDFLQDTPGAVPTMPIIRKSALNWADEVEDNHDLYEPRSTKANVVLPTAPKASRDFDDIIDKVPQTPPFIAYLSNLPYDVDENEIAHFFRNMKIANMKIPKDDRTGDVPKLKGFGYVEFEDRESLLNALVIPDTTIKNRRIRIELSTDYDNDKRRGGRMDMNRDRSQRGDTSSGDWRSGPRQESSSDNNERRTFSRDRDRDGQDSSSSAWRDGDRRSNRDSDRPFTRSGDSDRPFTRSGDSDRQFTRSGDSDRQFTRSGDSDRPITRSSDSDRPITRSNDSDRPFTRSGNSDRPFTRSNDSDRSFTRSNDRYRDDDFRRDRDDKYMSRGSGGGGRYEGGGGRSDAGFNRGPPREEGQSAADQSRNENRQRPKLVLAPRSKPVEGELQPVASSTSIFGSAKPVDTSARERQIEERIAREHETAPPPAKERKDKDDSSPAVVEDEEATEVDVEEKVEEEQKEEVKKEKEEPKGDINGVTDKSHQRKNGDHDKRDKGENNDARHKPEGKKREEKREKIEREMPKLKKAEPPNFIANNKFAFLENEDTSD